MTIIRLAAKVATLAYLIYLAIYDIRHFRVTNRSILIFLPLAVVTGGIVVSSIPSMLLGAVSGFAILLGSAMLTKGGIGGGDIKLAAALGLATGLRGMLVLLVVASINAGLCGIVLRKRNKRVPFVPFMALGYVASALLNL